MKKVLIVLTFVVSSLVAQKLPLIVDASISYVKYTGFHILHNWSGQSNNIFGTIYIDETRPSESEVNISIPIFSFDSQNGNRDSNMLFFTDEDKYPNVSFSSTTISHVDNSNYNVTGVLNFHGIKTDISVFVTVNIDSDSTEFKSNFSVNLIDFNIKRPKLLLSPIKESIEIELYIKGKI
jgi:polyisoprenoid-binding protein YceI